MPIACALHGHRKEWFWWFSGGHTCSKAEDRHSSTLSRHWQPWEGNRMLPQPSPWKQRILLPPIIFLLHSKVEELVSACRRNKNLGVSILLDGVRGSRGSPNSIEIIKPLVESFPGSPSDLSSFLFSEVLMQFLLFSRPSVRFFLSDANSAWTCKGVGSSSLEWSHWGQSHQDCHLWWQNHAFWVQ